MPFLRKKGLFESNRVLFLAISSISPNPAQPRTYFAQDGLEELAASIAEHGILQPLSVRRTSTGFQLISGERRLRAAKLAGLTEVPCILVSADTTQSSILALVENVQRRDLDFFEEAQALQALLTATGLSQEAVAKQLGRSQSAVANKLRVLKLDPDALQLLRQGGATERHARALLRLPPELQLQAAQALIQQKLTVAGTEAYVDGLLHPKAPKPRQRTKIVFKDVRLFLNTVTKGLSVMQKAGVSADYQRQDTEDAILLTIRIPRTTP